MSTSTGNAARSAYRAAPGGGLNGYAVAGLFAGVVFLWSGIRGNKISATLRSLVAGDSLHGQTGAGSSTATPSALGSNRALGKLLAASYGWSVGPQWDALDKLWTRESNWDNHAENPSSGAYGIPQALPASKLPHDGQKPLSSPTPQIEWGLSYIRSRYRNPVNAWDHEQTFGWY